MELSDWTHCWQWLTLGKAISTRMVLIFTVFQVDKKNFCQLEIAQNVLRL